MKISTRGRYALILMLDLANHNRGVPVPLKETAKRQQISEKYLEQIISVLNKAGFVKSVRGPQGGYLLKKTPEEYTVGMILRQTEGDLMSISSDTSNEMEKASVINRVWDKMGKAVNDIVDNITLQDLLDWEEEQTEEAGFYVI